MIKGDSQPVKVTINIKNEPVKLGDNDKLTFSVRYAPNSEQYIFQKTKEDMEYNEERKCYEFMIEPEDTKQVELIENFRNLYYDLQFEGMLNGKKIVKTLKRGMLYLTYEITN